MILANLQIILPPEIEGARVAGHNKLCHINQSSENEKKKTWKKISIHDGKNEGIVWAALYYTVQHSALKRQITPGFHEWSKVGGQDEYSTFPLSVSLSAKTQQLKSPIEAELGGASSSVRDKEHGLCSNWNRA